MPVLQPTPRQSVTKQAALARRLIASSGIAQHVLDATLVDSRITQPVIRCKASSGFVVGRAVVLPNQHFYLVASKFTGRYYVVVAHNNKWTCSSKDCAVSHACIDKATIYRQSLLAKLAS